MSRKDYGLTNWFHYYCLHCGDEQEPYYRELLPKWDRDHGEIMEWGECPAHGDSHNLRHRVKITNKKHRDYIPMGHVIRWKADGEWVDEEGVEVTA